jgi:hypothetical protein
MADATDQAPKDLIGFLDFYLVKKAPFQLPDGFKEFVVKFGPWIALLLMLLAAPFLLAAIGIGAVAAVYGSMFLPAVIVSCVALVMRGLALPGLFARKMSGWKMLFYSQLVSMLASLLLSQFVSVILGGLISLYVMFQIRSMYKE